MPMTKTGPIKKLIIAIPLVFLLCSCGYQLVREKGIYGGDISSIYISIFKNLTYEPHISQYVTDAFSKELISTGLFTVNKESSDGYLQGTIMKITTTAVYVEHSRYYYREDRYSLCRHGALQEERHLHQTMVPL